MPKGKSIEKPSVKDTFFLGSVVSCLPGRSISFITSRKRYSFRFKLVFQSGVSKSIQRGGFPTRKAASSPEMMHSFRSAGSSLSRILIP